MTAIPTRPALRRRYERRQQEVVEIAAKLFADRGYQATSMVDLSEATGLTSGGLYHYIGSKEKLLFRIFRELTEPLLEQARAIEQSDAPAVDRIRSLLRLWLTHVEKYHHHMMVLGQERHVVESDPRWGEVRASRKAFDKVLGRVLEEVAPAPSDGSGIDRRLALLGLLGMVNYTPQWFRSDGRLSAEQVADGYCDMMLAALGVPSGR
jgi:AcrR family transcriptional regulator